MAKLHSILFRACGFLLLFGVTRVSGVRIRKLEVPEMAQAGHEVHLLCDYDLERARLYQVKWYKGSHEFYRYSPREEAKLFLVENLDVDLRKSDDRTVVLKNLHVDMTGSYTCEVSTEGFFETALGKSNMTVIELPRGGPHIQGYRRQIVAGESIRLNCTSLKSRPAAELYFLINDRYIKPRSRNKYDLRRTVIVDEESNQETALLSMVFKVKPHHIRHGKMKVTCIAKIKGMYQKNRTEVIYEAVRNERIEKLPDGGLPSAASGASSSSSNLATVNVISIFGGHLQNKRGSIKYEDSYSGVPPTNRGLLMVAILLNVVLLQLFGYAIIGEYSLPCFLYHSTKSTMEDDCSSVTEKNSQRHAMIRNQNRNKTNNTSRYRIPKLNIPDCKLLPIYKRCENM